MKAVVAALLLLAVQPLAARPLPWRQAITEADRKRLAGLWTAWREARAQVEAGGHATDWADLGDLADPAALAEGGPPPPGDYRCRTAKLGSRNPGMPVWTMMAWRRCQFAMAGDYLRFVDAGGAQRTAGLLYADGDRMVYLGAVSLGSEPGLFGYNRDAERNQVGVLHRIGPLRWRLELPFPRWESELDLIEIVPA